jgi:hypothetical protein
MTIFQQHHFIRTEAVFFYLIMMKAQRPFLFAEHEAIALNTVSQRKRIDAQRAVICNELLSIGRQRVKQQRKLQPRLRKTEVDIDNLFQVSRTVEVQFCCPAQQIEAAQQAHQSQVMITVEV